MASVSQMIYLPRCRSPLDELQDEYAERLDNLRIDYQREVALIEQEFSAELERLRNRMSGGVTVLKWSTLDDVVDYMGTALAKSDVPVNSPPVNPDDMIDLEPAFPTFYEQRQCAVWLPDGRVIFGHINYPVNGRIFPRELVVRFPTSLNDGWIFTNVASETIVAFDRDLATI